MSAVKVSYFSDALCIWAYVAQARIDAVRVKFGDTARLDHRFCSVFANTAVKIPSTWREGEYARFNAHLRNVAQQFPHIEIHPDIWLKTRPPTSTSAHLFMIAVQQRQQESEREGQGQTAAAIFDRLLWAFRCAFFRDGRDIARWDVQWLKLSALTSTRSKNVFTMEPHLPGWLPTTRMPRSWASKAVQALS
jgi:predicted DsbA family dithiol-disulfide isomerase